MIDRNPRNLVCSYFLLGEKEQQDCSCDFDSGREETKVKFV
jgi:hypothetical protein